MKTKSSYTTVTCSLSTLALRMSLCALLALAGLTGTLKIHAASQTWTNAPADNQWTNVLNWNSKAVPGALNSANTADVATFTNALPISGIGGAGNPITNDLTRGVNGLVFNGPDCGAYVFGNSLLDNWLEIMQGGNITINAAVTNPITFNTSFRTKLPSSTNGRYDFTNNAASPDARIFIAAITNSSANTRPMELHFAGSNTGTNTVALIDDQLAGSGAILIIKEGTGKWIFTGPNDLPQKTSASVVATVQVNNGTLEVRDPASLGLITVGNLFVQTNGTLQIDGVSLNNTGITLRNGGTIRMNGSGTVKGVTMSNVAGNSDTLATTSASDVLTIGDGTVANQMTGGAVDSVLHISGPGTVVLSQPGNYAGRWSVDSGTNQLSVQGALGAGPNLNLNAGAVFDVTPIGAVTYTLDTKGFSANGTGTAVGSTAATVMADPGGTIDFASRAMTLTFTPVSSTGDSGHPALYCSRGTLSFHGNAITVNNASGTPLQAGNYQLVAQASGNILSSGAFVTLVTGSGLAAGMIAEINPVGGNLNLVVTAYTPKGLVWTGSDPLVPGVWDRQTSTNWLAGATPSTFNIYDGVTFNATGAAQPIVTLAATMVPGSITVDTSAGNYTFTGAGQIAGGSSLVKINTSGTLTLQTANTYTGGTIISNGVVKLGIDEGVSSTGPAGTNDVTIYSPAVFDLNNFTNTVNALLGNGTVDITGGSSSILNIGYNGDSGVFSGLIQNTSGTLGITKVGTGTETITSSNSYVGPTVVDTGTLRVTNLYALGGGNSPVTINSGTLDMDTSLIVTNLNGGGFVVNSSAFTNILTIQTNSTYGGVISGKIGVLVNAGTLRLNAANTYSNGTIVAAGANLAIGGGAANPGPAGVIASNNVTISQPNTASGSSTFAPPVTTVDGATVTFVSSTTANNWGNQFNGSALATNIFANGNMSIGGTYSFSNFLGTVIITNGGVRMGPNTGLMGGDNTTFYFVNGGGMFTRDAGIVRLGALFGGGNITGPSVAFPGTYWIGAKGIDCEFSGGISGSNNIVKVGSGRLTLDGNLVTTNTDSSTYTNYVYASALSYLNSTTISNGVLAISVPNDLSYSPAITLAATNAILDILNMGYVITLSDINSQYSVLVTNGMLTVVAATPNGTPQVLGGIGFVKGNGVTNNGTINPGLAGFGGTLTISNSLVVNAGATNYFDLSDDPSGAITTSDVLKMQNNVTLTGNSIIGIGALNGVINPGKYSLIKYGGNLINESGMVPSGPVANLSLGGTVPAITRATLVLSNAPGELDLVVVSLNNTNLVWSGDGASNWWDVVNSVTFTNEFGTPMQFYQLDNVTFDNSGTNRTAFLQGTVVPSSLVVNSSSNYFFGGPGNIGGDCTLTKSGTGSLTMTNSANNTYAGGVVINGGILKLGVESGGNQNDFALGIGTATVNTSGELRFGGNSGTVVHHSITNAIVVNGGTVTAADGYQHLTNSTVTVNANGGTFFTVYSGKNLSLESRLAGAGAVTISVGTNINAGQVVLVNSNNTFSGTVAILTNANLALAGFGGLTNCTSIDVQRGGILDISARSNSNWSVTSGQTLKGNGTIRGKFISTLVGSTLAPGVDGAIGTLTVTNNASTNYAVITLGGTTSMDINRGSTPNCDRFINNNGTNILGGTLTVNNLGATPQAGDTFQLLTSFTNTGAFATVNLPTLPSGLGWSNSLALNGKLTVVTTIIIPTNPPAITNFVIRANGNVEISGTNGQTGGTYYLLATTNLITPRNQWKTVATNVLGGNNYTFIGTNAVVSGSGQQFYMLSSTNYNP